MAHVPDGKPSWRQPQQKSQYVLPVWRGISLVSLALVVSAQMVSVATATSTTGTSLAGGVVTTRSVVDGVADLSLDLRDLRALTDDIQGMKNLYQQGRNAVKPSDETTFPLVYLSQIYSSTPSTTRGFTLTPNFMYHIYGLTSDMSPTSTMQSRLDASKSYQEDHIQEVISSHPNLAADAVIALSLWMYATHLLSIGVYTCHERTNADIPNEFQNMVHFDQFIAVWIGQDQTTASATEGSSLYAWVQGVNEFFDFFNTSPEATVNTRIILLYEEAASALALPGACSKENPDTVQTLWKVTTQIGSEMIKPLFQWLIYHLILESAAESALYAKALIPQLSRCRPSLHNRLAEAMRTGIQFSDKDTILRDLVEAYTSCFGLSCNDLSSADFAKDYPALTCPDNPNDSVSPSLAGYHATSAVAPLSRIDLDIRQMRILSNMEIPLFANFVYEFGSNALQPRDSENDPFELVSLNRLATSTTRVQADPYYTYFVNYFNERNYADNTMQQIFEGKSRWSKPMQQTEALVLTSAFQIVHMEILSQLKNTMVRCEQVDAAIGFALTSETDRHPIDNAAALIIGSLEGTQVGGSFPEDGELVWNLANKRAFQFKTMNDEEFATVNQELIDLLYAAKGEMDAGACIKLNATIDQITRLIQVGIIQSVVHAAVESQSLDTNSDHVSLVQGEVLAQSILPIIAALDADTAELIKENMVLKDGVDTVREGAQAVADGLGFYVTNRLNLPCSYVGATAGANPCAKYGSAAPVQRRTLFALIVTCLAGLVVTAL